MFKWFMRLKIIQVALGFILAAYMVLIKYSTRWDVEGFERVSSLVGSDQGLIALTWHSRFLMLNSAWKKKWQDPHVLISLSRDGKLVSYTTRFLSLSVIHGSARKIGSNKAKGGANALRQMKTTLENGHCIVITPDGPRGPRQKLGYGPLRLAKMTHCPIVPCTFSVKNRVIFNSWDRFVLPLPFGKGKIIWGQPVIIHPDASPEDISTTKNRIETEMNDYLKHADQAMGHDPIYPAKRS